MSKRDLAKSILKALGWTDVDAFVDSCDEGEIDDAVMTAVRAKA